jgi:hypothetical protein
MLLILATFSAPALAAEVYIDDSFDDLNKVDLLRTTAEVDTANGWVTLGPKNLANSLLLYTGNYDITLINGDAAETYRYNGAVMKGYVPLSVTGGLHEPVSIAGRMGEYLILERGAREAAWYHYDGSGMVKNGYQAISGLADPRALDVISGTYDFILLDGNSIRRYGYDGSGYLPIAALSVALPEANPLSISVEDDDFAFVILDKAEKAVRYYSLKGGVMREEAGKSVQTGELTNPRSLSVSKDGGLYLIADENQIKAYSYDGSRMVYNPHLSVQGLRKPLAVSLKPDMFDYAVLEQDIADNPQVSYFAFNGSGMTEIPGLRITGLEKITYANHQVLQGKAGEAHHEVSGLQLLAEEALPPGTSIAWEATVDGVNWQTIRPGGVARFAAPGTKPSYRALLHTDDKAVTPKIWSVRLVDASLSVNGFQITGLVGPDIPGNPMLPTDRQVRIWAGYNVHFCITTTGGAESVVADIRAGGETITLSSLLGGIMPDESSGTMMNIWTGTFHTGVGVPAGTPLDISFTVWKGTESAYAEYPEFALIQGSALDLHKIHLTH